MSRGIVIFLTDIFAPLPEAPEGKEGTNPPLKPEANRSDDR